MEGYVDPTFFSFDDSFASSLPAPPSSQKQTTNTNSQISNQKNQTTSRFSSSATDAFSSDVFETGNHGKNHGSHYDPRISANANGPEWDSNQKSGEVDFQSLNKPLGVIAKAPAPTPDFSSNSRSDGTNRSSTSAPGERSNTTNGSEGRTVLEGGFDAFADSTDVSSISPDYSASPPDDFDVTQTRQRTSTIGFTVSVSGTVMARISLRTLLFKQWKETSFWVRLHPLKLLIFRNKHDYKDWESNPYHNDKEREYLIKLKIDFANDILDHTNVKGYRVTDIKSKVYDKKLLHQFKLERIMDYGPNIAAAFASADNNELTELKENIETMIAQGRRYIENPSGYTIPDIVSKDFNSNDVSGRYKKKDVEAVASPYRDHDEESRTPEPQKQTLPPNVDPNSTLGRSIAKSQQEKRTYGNDGHRQSTGERKLGAGKAKGAYNFDDMIGDEDKEKDADGFDVW